VKTNVPLVNFRRMQVPTPWWLVIVAVLPVLGWRVARLLARLAVLAVRNARSLAVLVTGLWVWHRYGWLTLVVVTALLLVSAGAWWWRHRRSCERWLLFPVLSWWRRLWVYRRQWNEAMTLCGLVKTYDGGHKTPQLLKVRCSYATDEVVLRMPRGQNPEVYHKAAQNLAYSFNTRHCRVFSTRRTPKPHRSGRLAWLLRALDSVRLRDRPRHVWLVFIRRDPLTRTVDALPVPDRPDFTALPLGMREDSVTYLLRLLATHLLVVGATRAGKGSVIWSLVRALAAGVRSGLVRLWVIDPKGGMELFMGRSMFTRYEDSNYTAMADMLDDAIAVMRERQARLRGLVRVHTPTVADPLVVIVIDELACLLAYLHDNELKNRITASLSLLLSQGAGLGVLVVGASQDPRKEVLSLRDLFPTRIALRLNESGHVDLALGDGSRNRGALCDQIPIETRGVGYVVLDHHPEPARVRFAYVDDNTIKQMAVAYPAPDAGTAMPINPARTSAVPEQRKPADRRHVYRPNKPAAPLLPDALLHVLDPDVGRSQ
jgi:DNA segregation ATPase FtsK/SpoIIIE, S-DNA-T family